jgi:hypothetical protein
LRTNARDARAPRWYQSRFSHLWQEAGTHARGFPHYDRDGEEVGCA